MGFWDRFRRPVSETFVPQQQIAEGFDTSLLPPANFPARTGFEYGIPRGGNTDQQIDYQFSRRQQQMEALYDSYTECNWVSVCVDTVARTVTAGGLMVIPDDNTPETETPIEPPVIVELRRLLRFTNDREDMVQLLRSTITDLLVFGDAFLEVTRLLGVPVALYTLDATTMAVKADEHGNVTGYTQRVDATREAHFNANDVIHISLDSPRGGLYGVSPLQKALLPVKSYLFSAASLKETMRRGDPPRIHVDHARGTTAGTAQNWWESYMVQNMGTRNIGTPIMTIGGGSISELSAGKVAQYLESMRQLRDEILSVFGVPPSKAGVIESGNLGGGTGEAQDKTFRVNTVIPIQNLLLEKINYHLVQKGFGITGWHVEFEEIDYRDSKTVEEIRDLRLKAGAYTINRWREEIGEPPVDGGDDPILLLSRSVISWKDMEAYSQAEIEQMQGAAQATANLAGSPPSGNNPNAQPGASKDAAQGKDPQGKAPKETRGADDEMKALEESFRKAYQHRRRQALKALPKNDDA